MPTATVVPHAPVTVREMSEHFGEWFAQLAETGELEIVRNEGEDFAAVLMSAEAYHALQERLLIQKLSARGDADIAAGRVMEMDEFVASIEAEFQDKADQ